MSSNHIPYRRHSIRIQNYDYATQGAYFLTICTQNREMILAPKPIQEIISRIWNQLPVRFSNIQLDEFVVMPNHIHGIVWITNVGDKLGKVLAYFKYQTTKEMNIFLGNPNPLIKVWQRNYYERIIRDEKELNETRQYIIDNPNNWEKDSENIK